MRSTQRAVVVALAAVGMMPATLAAGSTAVPRPGSAIHRVEPERAGKPCARLFTLRGGERRAAAMYAGTRHVTLRERRRMGMFVRCQRNPSSTPVLRRYVATVRQAWVQRREPTTCPPMGCAVASWYSDGGSTASGFHSYYGVANKTLPFGTQVKFCYPVGSKQCVIATVDDRGPFIAGRDFDLNQNTAAALGFGGVATVAWQII